MLGAEAGVVEPVAGQAAELEVLDDDVAAAGQFADEALPLRLGEVDGDRAFVAVGAEEIGRIRSVAAIGSLDVGRAPGAGVVAGAGALDLDDVGAVVAEQLSGPGARQDAGQVEDFDMREWSRVVGYRHRRRVAKISDPG